MGAMTIMGDKTRRAVIQKSESHKLHHSFPVKKGKNAVPGQFVVLNDDGTVQGFETSDDPKKIIGVAVNNSNYPAYQESKQYGPVEVTVAMTGYMIVFAAAGAASLNAGPVKPDGNMVDGIYAKYIADDESTSPVAYNLTKATEDGELIQVLIR